MSIDEKTTLLVCIGAAMAANCGPCFEHYYGKATAAGITAGEITEVLEVAAKVKKGAHLALKNRISDLMKGQEKQDAPCGEPNTTGCCCG